MRPNEARKVGQILADLPVAALSPCINLGSSTDAFRRRIQPHIHDHVIGPLEARGIRIVHSDIKDDPEIDVVGDLFDDRTLEKLTAVGARSVLCCNMLEHVTDREELARRIDAMLQPGGHALITVPYSYPYHFDPIDTYFRPTPQEILALFGGYTAIDGGIVSDATYWQDLRARFGLAGAFRHVLTSLVKSVMIWKGRQWWIGHFHRYLWLGRPYRVSWLLARKPVD